MSTLTLQWEREAKAKAAKAAKAAKELEVKLLEAYAKNTDNTVDDKLVELVKKNLLGD